LAVLEMLVHFDHEDAPADYVSIALDIPDDVRVKTVARSSLPRHWMDTPPAEELQFIGSTWAAQGGSAILRVPSAIVTDETNYLINPAHPDFSRCRAQDPVPFVFDSRLL
jgi:RES domain-containing protein